ncbi:peptide-methionine (R)-S-oxide reductase MsrB [Novosphingobium huizhouense]|uniref:peptide-methionine (R)-S-oxide reductase MsrB n=1 Tax=Novosphingobium huizhouense TaxID=2866625 RepID=UPI001CD86F6E|nr:peptide-methionine (R)-S-oxide reductase MsrB [Novosphingobium huizhouense]
MRPTDLAMTRRHALGGLAAVSTLALASACGAAPLAQGAFPVRYSDAEWKRRLTPEQYFILRQAGTERPFTSPLLREHRKGTFVCAADGNPLFASSTKFDSGTGWPSFWKPLDRAVGTSADRSYGMARTEVHCLRCGGHLGHVFDDGPKPTGLRYCMNGDAMLFRPG